MGFLAQDTNNIIIDAVLTDLGRQKLAAGTFSIIKFAAGDDEVDYGMITRYGRTVGQEKIEKNTPVFEAITNNKLALMHPLLSIPDPNRYTLPNFLVTGTTTIVLGTNTNTTKNVHIEQTLAGGEAIPQELVDNQFMVICDDRFIRIVGSTPVIDRNRMATYIVTRDGALSSQGGAVVTIPVNAKAITSASFQIYGKPDDKTTIRSGMRVTGMSTGTMVEFVAQIKQG